MQIDLKRNGLLLALFIAGLIIFAVGYKGRFGLLLGAIFTPEYLTVQDA